MLKYVYILFVVWRDKKLQINYNLGVRVLHEDANTIIYLFGRECLCLILLTVNWFIHFAEKSC